MREVPFEHVLKDCLQELIRTEDVEALLEQFPEHADRLRPLIEIAYAIRQHYKAVPEAPGGLTAGREHLLAMAAQRREQSISSATGTRVAARSRDRIPRLAFSLRLIAVVVAVLMGTAVLGAGLVWAASDSLPGDLLYPVKLAVEDVRLALNATPVKEAELALGFVEVRAGELEALAMANRHIPDETVARMEQHIELALTQAAWTTDSDMPDLLLRIAERTRAQERRLLQVQSSRQPGSALQRAVAFCQWGARAAEDGLSDLQGFRLRYQHRNEQLESPSDPEQDRNQNRHQESEEDRQQKPQGVPQGTPHGPRATVTPQPERQRLRETATSQVEDQIPSENAAPQVTPKRVQPIVTSSATPQEPRVPATPQATARGPQPTAEPQVTLQGPEPAATLQPTPQGPGPNPNDPAGTPGPQQPSGGQGGGH